MNCSDCSKEIVLSAQIVAKLGQIDIDKMCESNYTECDKCSSIVRVSIHHRRKEKTESNSSVR